MKATKCILAMLFVVFLLAGCHVGGVVNTTGTSTSAENNNAALTAADLYRIDADFTQDYETAVDYLQSAEAYVKSGSARADFVERYQAADYLEAYPVFGTYLETTRKAVYLFYKNSIPVGIAMLKLNQEGIVTEASTYVEMTTRPDIVNVQSLEECFLVITDCIKKYPDFDILGVVYDANGFSRIYPVGICSGESIIKYVYEEPMCFSLVEPFTTIEEGRNAFKAYILQKEETLCGIPIYPWTNANFNSAGYLSGLYAEIDTNGLQVPFYMNIYDAVVAVPLLDESLQEDVYMLHMLYYRNQLIAELVIRKERINDRNTYTIAREQIAEKTAEGAYIPIAESEYIKALNSAVKHHSDWSIQGVVFRNSLCLIMLDNNTQMLFDPATNTLQKIQA